MAARPYTQQLGASSSEGKRQDLPTINCPDSTDDDSDSDLDEPDGLQTRNAALQELFAAEMQDLAQKRGHSRVGVLLIQWEVEDPSYIDTKEEVKTLRAVLEKDYHFAVHEKYLHTRQSPQNQLICHLADFVRDEDDENALLIVYYAGHGRVGKGKLFLQGGNSKKGKHWSRVLWNEVEHHLERAKADLLVIFDCCYAGLLATDDHRAPPPKKIFEFLGATLHNRTAVGPGPHSFTTALVWALRELVNEADGFTTSQLVAMIKKAPDFDFEGRGQEPTWSPRGKNPSLFRLKISPLDRPGESGALQLYQAPDTPDREDTNQIYLQLQLAYDRVPNRRHIKVLAASLKNTVHDSLVPMRQARWRGLTDENVKMGFKDAAWMKVNEVKRRRRKHSSTSKSPEAYTNTGLESSTSAQAMGNIQITTTTHVDSQTLYHLPKFNSLDAIETDQIQRPFSAPSRHRAHAIIFLAGCCATFGALAACGKLSLGSIFTRNTYHEG